MTKSKHKKVVPPQGAITSKAEFLALLDQARAGKVIKLYSISAHLKRFHYRILTKDTHIVAGKIKYHNQDGNLRTIKLSHRGLVPNRHTDIRGYFFTNYWFAMTYANKVGAQMGNRSI